MNEITIAIGAITFTVLCVIAAMYFNVPIEIMILYFVIWTSLRRDLQGGPE